MSDATLNSVAYIPACEAYVTEMLSNGGYAYASLSANDQKLVQAAEIALVCKKVISDAPVAAFKTGPIEEKPVSASDKKAMMDILENEFQDLMDMLDCPTFTVTWTVSDGSDYTPDGSDETNIAWSDEDTESISVWD